MVAAMWLLTTTVNVHAQLITNQHLHTVDCEEIQYKYSLFDGDFNSVAW